MKSNEAENEVPTVDPTKNEQTGPKEQTSSKEDFNDEKEENPPIPSTSKALDSKSASDAKNSTVKIVKGNKRMRLEVDPSHSTDKKDGKDDQEAEAKVMRSLKRSCELWSMEDKNTFFKAVNEYGKDFDALQNYFLIQGKKKGVPEKMIKNKEQIRHFYYRTWLKISKHLKFSEDVKKTSQELYGLINYGELRRKLPRMHEKVPLKLNELVFYGSTQVRLRGKTMRIKTPICRALRKLNKLEGWQEEIKLPSRVTIELRPGNNLTWWQVQSLSMNPRVRTLAPIQRRLSSILSYLQQRWRCWRAKNPAEAEDLAVVDSKNIRLLRVAPTEGCKISLPVVNLGEYLTSNSVSLNSYENRLGLKSSKAELLGSAQNMKGVGKKSMRKSRGDKRLSSRLDDVPDNSDIDLPESEKISVTNNGEKSSTELPLVSAGFPGRESVERIRQGWNVEDANTITVGDLFLMFGRDSKIVLEYWWETIPSEPSSEKIGNVGNSSENSLSLALQKLLSIAKHNFGTSKGYDNVSGSNETVISSRIPSTKESTFIRPLIPQAYHKMGAPEAFKSQLDKYNSRYGRRGKMVRQRNLVVQRVLPSTPPLASSVVNQVTYPNNVRDVSVGTKTESLTDMPAVEKPAEASVKMLSSSAEGEQKHFLGVLEGADTDVKVTNSTSSITSAMQILKEGEQQWMNNEDGDFSLSSFLVQLESPVKSSQRSQAEVPTIEIIAPSSGMTNIHCLVENSVDYVAKFANFASQIASEEQKK